MAAILKMVLLLCLGRGYLISMKFDADANFNTKTRYITKIKILQILSTTLAQ